MAKKTIKKVSEIRNSLINQLKANNADVSHFEKLVDDYLFYDEQEKAMQDNVKKSGFIIEMNSANGGTYEKENPAVKMACLYNKQKLSILKQLNLTIDNVNLNADDEL